MKKYKNKRQKSKKSVSKSVQKNCIRIARGWWIYWKAQDQQSFACIDIVVLSLKNIAEPDIELMKMKMLEILQTLREYKKNPNQERSRSSYLDELVEIFCSYYGYNRELMDLFS
jgi:hypothetical protein